MKLVSLEDALKRTRAISGAISYRCLFQAPQFTSGVVAFRNASSERRKQITHADKDLVCHVLKGRGRLRVRRRRFTISRGMVCHIPHGTPHDFSADGRAALVLFYSLIEARGRRRRRGQRLLEELAHARGRRAARRFVTALNKTRRT